MITFNEFKKLDLRIAKVVDVSEHPDADKLLILQVDTGEKTKQIIAGLKGHYEPEALLGRNVVVVNNLEPVELRGELSDGMLLAAEAEEGPVLIVPAEDVPPGSRIR